MKIDSQKPDPRMSSIAEIDILRIQLEDLKSQNDQLKAKAQQSKPSDDGAKVAAL